MRWDQIKLQKIMTDLLFRCIQSRKADRKVSLDFGEGEGHAVPCCSVLCISKSCSLIFTKAVSRGVADHKWNFSHSECIRSSTGIVQYSSYADICPSNFDISYGVDLCEVAVGKD